MNLDNMAPKEREQLIAWFMKDHIKSIATFTKTLHEVICYDYALCGRLISDEDRKSLGDIVLTLQECQAHMEFICHDWCGWNEQYGRFTHMPSGDTLVCGPYMSQTQWDKAQLDYFRKYPGLTVYKCPEGTYRKTDETFGTTEEICSRLKKRLLDSAVAERREP